MLRINLCIGGDVALVPPWCIRLSRPVSPTRLAFIDVTWSNGCQQTWILYGDCAGSTHRIAAEKAHSRYGRVTVKNPRLFGLTG